MDDIQLGPRVKRYIITKEVRGVSIADAVRKERSGEILTVAEAYEQEYE